MFLSCPALIALFIVACGSNSSGVSTKLVQDASQDNAKNCLVDAPKWFSNPGSNEAVGTGESRDLAFSRTKAETDARTKLANSINVQVNNVINAVERENATAFAREVTQVTETVVSELIQGMSIDKYYLCPKMVGGVEGYQSFALVSVDLKDAVAAVKAELNRQKEASSSASLDNFLDGVNDQLDSAFE